jgi:hypothetical protein
MQEFIENQETTILMEYYEYLTNVSVHRALTAQENSFMQLIETEIQSRVQSLI